MLFRSERRMAEIRQQIPAGLCAAVYTQLSDVEEEVNGIFTFDREINKLCPADNNQALLQK